jgi:hypothetical protein
VLVRLLTGAKELRFFVQVKKENFASRQNKLDL